MLKYLNYSIVFREIPDKTFLAFNVTGCENSCDGCHSPELREDIGTELKPKHFLNIVKKYVCGIDGVLFLGEGKSSDKPLLLYLASLTKNERLLTALYSGRSDIPNDYYMFFDYIKIGPYVKTLGGLDSPTTNQRLYYISKPHTITDITHLFWKNVE